jgi:hypothetical protein
LYIDNTAGANNITIESNVDASLSSAATASAASFGNLVIANGIFGMARFTLMFSSPTTYVFSRTA